jgi:dTDP-4-amino-4,6-dideoxygalactose transaminase
LYQEVGRPYRGHLPVTEGAAANGLALPLFSHMNQDIIKRVVGMVREILE